MKRTMILVAALALMTIPGICSAAPAKTGPYVSGFLGVNVLQNTDVSGSNVVNQPINDRIEFDPSINVGGTGGYDFGFFRMEGELSYKHGEISGVNDTLRANSYGSTRGSLGAFAVMFNGFFDLQNDSPVTPYFGGGVGFATLHLSDISGISRTAPAGRITLYDADDATVLAYQLGAGMEIALNSRLSLDLGYRYFATDTATFNGSFPQDLSLKFQSHSGTVGLRVKF